MARKRKSSSRIRLTGMALLSLPFSVVELMMASRLNPVATNSQSAIEKSLEASLSSLVRPNIEDKDSKVQMIILRAIGNALPPRHSPEQTLQNLDFTLQHEVLPSDQVTRHWFVNKLVDSDVEKQVIEHLSAANESYTVVPFNLTEYDKIPFSFDYLSHKQFSALYSKDKGKGETQRNYIDQVMQHDRILYTINVNGVRNDMIRYGKEQSNAQYIAPLDGNCFVTQKAWKEIETSLRNNDKAKYFVVPTDRLIGPNEELLKDNYQPNAIDEPQIIFHRESIAEFNPKLRYGRRNKVELLNRLNAPGHWTAFKKWNKWESELLGPQNVPDLDPKKGVPTAGWVSRLHSGNTVADQLDNRGLRGQLRSQAVPLLMERLDLRAAQQLHNFSSSSLVFYNYTQLEVERQQWKQGKLTSPINELLKAAAKSLTHGPWSVMDKKKYGCGLSGDCQVYFHANPNFWPKLDKDGQPDMGRPWDRIKEKHMPGTNLYEAGSDKYDLSRFTAMQHNTTLLALAYSITQDDKYAAKAADNLKHWFLDPETRMKPTLQFAQAYWNGKRGVGNMYGLIEMKNAYFFLDAVRMVEASGALSQTDQEELRQWFHDYLEWLMKSKQAKEAMLTSNHHGLYYDIQVIAVAAYANEMDLAVRTMHRAITRLGIQLNNKDGLSNSLKRTECEHFQMFTLQGWSILARLSSTIGVNVWNNLHNAHGHSAMCRAMKVANPLLQRRPLCNKNDQIVDHQRWWPLWYETKRHCPEYKNLVMVENIWMSPEALHPPEDPYQMPSLYDAADGIAPFWNLGLGP